MSNNDIIVVGTSAGGVDALQKLAQQFPPDLAAAVFVVLHTSSESPGLLPEILDRAGNLTAKFAKDGEHIETGTIYVAPANQHLLVKKGYVRLSRGPRENRARPAIDPLFRSAAAAYTTRVVGVILTGFLDDGAAGLAAIKKCGGTAVVQDPNDAAFPDMPQSALELVEADYVAPLSAMGKILEKITSEKAKENGYVPPEIIMEANIAEETMSNIPKENRLGDLVPFGCPECGGPLWQMETDKSRRFRCHVGHGYTARSLIAEQDESIERALWAAMRAMEERANIVTTMAKDERKNGRDKSAELYEERAEESRTHAAALRKLLVENV